MLLPSETKKIYVDVKRQNILKRAVDIANSKYGMNFDLAIRGKEIRDLLQMYSNQTGGKYRSMYNAQGLFHDADWPAYRSRQ